jgi:hypothetical protein
VSLVVGQRLDNIDPLPICFPALLDFELVGGVGVDSVGGENVRDEG